MQLQYSCSYSCFSLFMYFCNSFCVIAILWQIKRTYLLTYLLFLVWLFGHHRLLLSPKLLICSVVFILILSSGNSCVALRCTLSNLAISFCR